MFASGPTLVGPTLAADDALAASLAQGYVEIGRTEVEVTDSHPLFEGCEIDQVIELANGQRFVCAESRPVADELGPEALILRHPATGAVRLVAAGQGFAGTLEGTAVPSAATPPIAPPVTPPVTPPVIPPVTSVGAPPAPAGIPLPVSPPAPAPLPTTQPPTSGPLPAIPAPPPPPAPLLTQPAPAPRPGPRPPPPGFAPPGTPAAQPGTGAPPPTGVRLIAPVAGTWQTSATLGGAKVEGVAMLNPDGTFNRFERWEFGLTVQVWGTYSATAITPTRFQLSQKPTGWDPREWCMRGNACQPLDYPASTAQFTFIDANHVRDDQTQVVYERQPH